MGVLDALGDVNDAVKQGTDAVLDNPALSIQDTVRNTAADLQGKSEDEFAETNASLWQNISNPVFDAVSKEGGDSVVHKAGEGVEVVTDTLAGYPVQIANSSLTGVEPDPIYKDTDNDPSTEYAPGALDTAELALTVGTGGASRAISGAARGGLKAGRAATRAGSAATKGAKAGNNMGILSRTLRGAQDFVTGGSRSAQAGTSFRAISSNNGVYRTLDDATPAAKQTDGLTPGGANAADDIAASIRGVDDAADAASDSRGLLSPILRPRNLAIAGGTAGAAGLIGGQGLPNGYTKDLTYQGPPKAERIRVTDGEGGTVGYYVGINFRGDTFTSIEGPATQTEVTLPTNTDPPFSSAKQADAAYERWQKELRNNETTNDTRDSPQEPTPGDYVWGEMSRIKAFASGWYLYRQENNTNDEKRYFVAGYDSNNKLLFITGNGRASYKNPTPFDTAGRATQAYNAWARRAKAGTTQARPDPGADRPNARDVLGFTRQFSDEKIEQGGGGGMGMILALVGGVGLVGAAIYFGVI